MKSDGEQQQNHGGKFRYKSGYHARLIKQTIEWVNGVSTHNFVDDECCPDFSCCASYCFTEDRAERLADAHRLGERCNLKELIELE